MTGTGRLRRALGTRARRMLIVVVGTYLCVLMLVSMFQSRLIYFPSRVIAARPTDLGLPFEEVRLNTRDGVRISAWWVPRDDAHSTILFLHGNAGNNGDRLPEVLALHSFGYNVLLVDYRGFGTSEGSPSETGTYLDADAAWEYATRARGIRPSAIAVIGESIGGAVAIDLARRVSPGALVILSSFTSLADIAAIHYPYLPVRWLLRHRYDSIAKIGEVRCPKLFFHGAEDGLVPLSNGRALFEAASSPKEFIVTPGGHNDGGFLYSDEFSARLRDFVDAVTGASARR